MDNSNNVPMKCRKCRFILLHHPQVPVEDSHGEPFITSSSSSSSCNSEVWYIPEALKPSWLDINLEKGEWVKGKINCPKCDARIGSYNFVSGFKCPCGSRVVPPIHIVKSKVDFTNSDHIPNPVQQQAIVDIIDS